MLNEVIHKDIELFIYLNNLGSIQWDGFWLFITNKYSAIPLYLLLLFFTYKYFGLKKTVIILISIALLITISDQTSNFFKYNFARLRPCYNENIVHLIRLVKESCGGKYSYFSAHAANSMALAIFFSLLFKKYSKLWIWLLIIWALLVGYSRIYIGVHFPLDILTGFFFGIVYGIIFYYAVNFFIKN